MNILIIGSGGREHALAWKMKNSPLSDQIYITPGNPGTASIGINLYGEWKDFDALKNAIIQYRIGMVVIGPEDPLVLGLTDYLEENFSHEQLIVIGPTKESAQLEGSKSYAKIFMQENEIPTSKYESFQLENISEAFAYIDKMNTPIVVKADGLAGGKGVVICPSKEEARIEVKNMMDGKFEAAGKKVILEEFLSGREFSLFILTDGETYKILPLAKDYKKIGEGDSGPNTGGMGAISPVPFVDDKLMDKVVTKIIEPTMNGLKKRSLKYHGFIFFGLIEVNGDPYVIEYNCRLGDPETEVVMPRMHSDLVAHLKALHDGNLRHEIILIEDQEAATVMLVSGGYPGNYEKNKPINIPADLPDSIIFHAGTTLDNSNKLVTNGGRVIAVSSLGNTIEEALKKSYTSIKKISFEGMNYRKDIGTF
ncbi:MAG: phosphoribosylamine--glycine ligase [Saprospiraceae bacterium]